jgi:hypothetical protein
MEEQSSSTDKSLPFSFDRNKIKFGLIAVGVVAAVLVSILLFVNIFSDESIDADSGPEEVNLLVQSGINVLVDSVDFDALNSNSPLDAIDLDKIEDEFKDLSSQLKYLKSPDDFDKLVSGNVVHDVYEFTIIVNDEPKTELDFAIDLFTSYPKDYSSKEGDNFLISLMQGEEISVESIQDKKYLLSMTSDIKQGDETMFIDMNIMIDKEDTFLRINQISPNELGVEQDLIGQYIRYDTERVLNSIQNNIDPSAELGVGELSNFQNPEDIATQYFEEIFSQIGATELALIKANGPSVVESIRNNLSDLEIFTDIYEKNPMRDSEDLQCFAGNLNTLGIVNVIENIVIESMAQFSNGAPLMNDFSLLESADLDALSSTISLQLTICNNTGDIFNRGFGAQINTPELLFNGGFITVTYDSDQLMDSPDEYIEAEEAGLPIEAVFGSLQPVDASDEHAGEEVTLSPEVEALIDRYLSGEITFEQYLEELEDLE